MTRADLEGAMRGLVVANLPAGDVEQTHWLCPLEDRSEQGAAREGMLAGMSLPKYLLLVDYTAHLFRQGKAHLSADVAPIFERLGTTAEMWEQRLMQLKATLIGRKITGRFLATTREVLSAAARRLGLHHLVNLAGREHMPAPLKPAPLKPAPSG